MTATSKLTFGQRANASASSSVRPEARRAARTASLLAAEDLITGDRYIFVRDAYLQQREYFVTGGAVVDTFSDFEDEIDWDE